MGVWVRLQPSAPDVIRDRSRMSCHGAVRSWLRLHGAETGLFRVHEENVQDKLRSLPFQLHACKVDVSDQSVMFGHVWASEQGVGSGFSAAGAEHFQGPSWRF